MFVLRKNYRVINAIASKNFKIKLRNYQTYLYSIGFPLVFTLLFYFIFNSIFVSASNFSIFDFSIAGLLVYTASFGTINAATALTQEKERQTLIRLDTTPVSRTCIFLGTLLSESVFLIFQLCMMYVVCYGFLGAKWHNSDSLLLVAGFIIIYFFGLSTLGIGIIISAYAKTADSAVGISIMYVIPMLFISGAMIPYENPIVYFCPPFWANQLYKQVVIMGDNFWTGSFRLNSINILEAEFSSIPLWSSFIIFLILLVGTILVGIKLFQRKTLN
ncbi:MAG: ABC transporter permease [Candidatus Hodarchaeales archaeon]